MIAPKTQKAPHSKKSKHCESDANHPDHSEFLPRLKRVGGQISGLQRMIEEGRYCVDILVQFRAAMAAMRSVEISIFERHIEHCLSSALLSKDKKQVDEKIKELTDLLSRRTLL